MMLFSFLNGGGEMGALIRNHDWAQTTLGEPQLWPQSLRTVLRLLLNARRPSFIFWGPEKLCLYNQAYSSLLAGRDHAAALGQPASVVLGDVWPTIGAQIEKVMQNGDACHFYNQPISMLKGAGASEAYWNYSFTPIDDEHSPHQIGGVLVTTSDTTANVLEQQLAVAEAKKQRSLLQKMPGFVAVVAEPEHRFEYVNDAFIALSGDRDFIGRTAREVYPDIEGQGFFELMDNVYTSGEPYYVRERAVRFAGEQEDRFIDLLYTPTRGSDGGVNGIFAGGYDVTEQVRAKADLKAAVEELRKANVTLEERIQAAMEEHALLQDALRQSQKMEAVGQLTGGLAHDFNNLLASVSGSLQLIRKRVTEGRTGELGKYVEAAEGGVRRAAALTHRLLAFSRRQTLAPEPLNLNRLVKGMEELLRRTMGPHIELEVVSAVGLWGVHADRGQLENALLNLCLNGRDAMPQGGKLTVETANRWIDGRTALQRDLDPGQYVSICVSDTGTGMPAAVVDRAFEPFFTTKPLGVGTGLGLSMVYGFAKQSGGQVRIYSEVAKGTMVCIYLPRVDVSEAEKKGEVTLPPPPAAERGETVLVVDDEADIRMLIVELMTDLGYTTLEAADGAEALALLRAAGRIDLLLTDVGLPGGMNGRQVADAARVFRHGLKVLFLTGFAENAVLSHGDLESGMEVMTKPFDIDVLARRVKRLVTDTE